ncbi:MAG: cytochrome c3 family protein [Kofleriaceae bacterium]|nr:cytochrome c3 family protein [Myxococcales bacterium]MCB9559305.1 cytochrome c3 family protein [Kofleriaceae bacterium]
MSRVIFPEWTQTLKKATRLLILGAPVYLVLLIAFGVSDGKAIRIGYQPDQPVPYSHALHAGELGIDCRYCHSTVERAAKAAIPPAATCMNCHASVRPESPLLLPVREAFAGVAPVRWVRVHDLPDYVYFNHSAHVTRGVGCEQCHGRIDRMVKVSQEAPLTMGWCLDCHRNPAPRLRRPEFVTVMGYKPAPGEGAQVMKELNLNPPTNCSTCHR